MNNQNERQFAVRDCALAAIATGERATWPKIEMIRNCTLVGRTLDRVLDGLEREAVVRAARGNTQSCTTLPSAT